MTDVTQDRVLTKTCGQHFADPLADGAIIPVGAMYVIDDDGNATPATASSQGPVRGVALRRADATKGDKLVEGARGIYLFQNSATAPLTRADIRTINAKVEDCHTVSKASSGPSAGKVFDVTEEGVFVSLGEKW